MTPIEGLLVWSSPALTPLLGEDNTRSPSTVAIATFLFLNAYSFDELVFSSFPGTSLRKLLVAEKQ